MLKDIIWENVLWLEFAKSSPNYGTFFHLALEFAGQNPRGRYYYSGVKQGHLI